MHDTGDGAAILLYDLRYQKIVLIKQYRLAAMINEKAMAFFMKFVQGWLKITIQKQPSSKKWKKKLVFLLRSPPLFVQCLRNPRGKNRKIHFFTAKVDLDQTIEGGGGMEAEQEDIEVVIMPFDEAWENSKKAVSETSKP